MVRAVALAATDPAPAGQHRTPVPVPVNVALPRNAPTWPEFQPLRVTRVIPESSTISSIRLTARHGQPVPDLLSPIRRLTMRSATVT